MTLNLKPEHRHYSIIVSSTSSKELLLNIMNAAKEDPKYEKDKMSIENWIQHFQSSNILELIEANSDKIEILKRIEADLKKHLKIISDKLLSVQFTEDVINAEYDADLKMEHDEMGKCERCYKEVPLSELSDTDIGLYCCKNCSVDPSPDDELICVCCGKTFRRCEMNDDGYGNYICKSNDCNK